MSSIVSMYTLLNSVNYDLWISIQVDFADFIEKHFDQLNESIWKSLLDYCYSHNYWIDHESLRKCLTNFLKILNVNSEYSNNWIVDQIRWVKYNYKKLSSNIRQRKQKIIEIINIIQSKIIFDEKETIIKVELKTYSYSQAAQSQDARFRSLQSSSNQQITQNNSLREFHYSQISKDQTSAQISQYFIDASVNYEHSSKQSLSSSLLFLLSSSSQSIS
jgi:hypothetical protein